MLPTPQAKPYVLPRLHNGVGNMLFQIAAAYTLAESTGRSLAIIESLAGGPRHHAPERYRTNFFARLPYLPDGTEMRPEFRKAPVYREVRFAAGCFDQQLPRKGSFLLDGYFQNEGYFRPYASAVVELFNYKPQTGTDLLPEGPACSIHVRRGDYRDLPGIHPVVGIDYLRRALARIADDRTFLIFSDDLPWCETHLPAVLGKRPHRFVPASIPDYDALALMARCQDNIIANSTFSWWAAYLNPQPRKQVIAPRNWFTPSHADTLRYDLDLHPIVPEAWIIL